MPPEKKQKKAVVNYIAILFLAAFCLLLLTYLMEQRQVAEAIEGLRGSVSSTQSLGDLYEKNAQLQEEKEALTQELHDTQLAMKAQKNQLEDSTEDLESAQTLAEEQAQMLEVFALFWELSQEMESRDKTQATELIKTILPGEEYLYTYGDPSPSALFAQWKAELLPDLDEDEGQD